MKKILKKITPPFLFNLYHLLRGVLAAVLYGFPSRKLTVVGVTGTNGKTTTCHMIGHILEAVGEKVGLATTVSFWVGQKKWTNQTKMTTLSPFVLQKLLSQMVKNACRYAVLEVSSHALKQHRVWGIFFDLAVLTNMSAEHLDYHPTFSDYQKSKEKLFAALSQNPKENSPQALVVNLDEPTSPAFLRHSASGKIGYTTKNTSAPPGVQTVQAEEIKTGKESSSFWLVTYKGNTKINLRLPGIFNIQNALAAASAALVLKIDLNQIKTGLESLWQMPGRVERVEGGQNFDIIIDYAHTPDGFEKVLSFLKENTNGKLIAVFGAAGERDRSKRPHLGEMASRWADVIILTEEDPASEDPGKIIQEILPGIDKAKFQREKNFFITLNRPQAIKQALSLAQEGDTVALLAMGAQTVMAKKEGKVPYNEKEVVLKILEEYSSSADIPEGYK